MSDTTVIQKLGEGAVITPLKVNTLLLKSCYCHSWSCLSIISATLVVHSLVCLPCL